MAEWQKREFNLSARHRWKAKPGNRISVADRGAARFEIPNDWVLEPSDSGSIRFYNCKPPDDDIRLEVSVIYLAAFSRTADWSGLPLPELLLRVTPDENGNRINGGPVVALNRGRLEIAWHEIEVMDPGENRPAFFSHLLGPRVRRPDFTDDGLLARGRQARQGRMVRRLGLPDAGRICREPVFGSKTVTEPFTRRVFALTPARFPGELSFLRFRSVIGYEAF